MAKIDETPESETSESETPVLETLVPVAEPIDSTVALDFGKAGKLTGITIIGNSHYGPNGEEVNACIPDGLGGYVQFMVPARFVVK